MASLVDRVSWRVSNRESIVESRKSLARLHMWSLLESNAA